MSLKIPDPNAISDKQWDFIVNLCADTLHIIPKRESLTFSEAQELIDDLLQQKKAMEKEMQEPELPPTLNETNYFEEGKHYGPYGE